MSDLVSRTVGVLFTGGSVAGANDFLRFFVWLGTNSHGARILGIKDGFEGLLRTWERLKSDELTPSLLRDEIAACFGHDAMSRAGQQIVELRTETVTGLVGCSGVVLGSAPGVLRQNDRRDCNRVRRLLRLLGIDALVIVGSDAAVAAAAALARKPKKTGCAQVLVVPATAENDCPFSEQSLGSNSAAAEVARAVRHVTTVASTEGQVIVVETMGRRSGHLTANAGLAAGATEMLVPEEGPLTEARMELVAKRVLGTLGSGCRHAVILVASGVPLSAPGPRSAAVELVQFLRKRLRQVAVDGVVRDVNVERGILGNDQQGVAPSLADVQLASRLSHALWQVIGAPRRASGTLGVDGSKIRFKAFGAKPLTRRRAELDLTLNIGREASRPAPHVSGLATPNDHFSPRGRVVSRDGGEAARKAEARDLTSGPTTKKRKPARARRRRA